MKKLFLLLFPILTIILLIINSLITEMVRNETSAISQLSRITFSREKNKKKQPQLAKDRSKEITPFKEVNVLDDFAHQYSDVASYGSAGLLIADFNGDNLLDVYIPQNSENIIRGTKKNGLLKKTPFYSSNKLYINTGNKKGSSPNFLNISTWKNNGKYEKEELLVENFLFPRQSSKEDIKRIGKISHTAISADFNGDGKLDILVGNGLMGVHWSVPENQYPFPQAFALPLTKNVQFTNVKGTSHDLNNFIVSRPVFDDTHTKIETYRGKEYYGENTLFINMGDKDNDGIPEWSDQTIESQVGGRRNTKGLCVIDVDLDGDLDVLEANIPDPDFEPIKEWAGGLNQIYVNQLAETGKLRFINKTKEFNFSGGFSKENPRPELYKIYTIPFIPEEYSLLLKKTQKYRPEILKINGQAGEDASKSWALVAQDVNDDGYQDIWVVDAIGEPLLYINEKGKTFRKRKNIRSKTNGFWMSLAPADFNGDLKEDMFLGNMGGNSSSMLFNYYTVLDPTTQEAATFEDFITDHRNRFHAIVSGENVMKEIKTKVFHSRYLPPDSLFNDQHDLLDKTSLDPYEFTWGSTVLDVENNGRADLYFHGSMVSMPLGPFNYFMINPGRLLINKGEKNQKLEFEDRTAEYNVFNIDELNYDKLKSEGYIWRKSPTQNWPKRDSVYSYDISSWKIERFGKEINSKYSDLIQLSSNGHGAIAADLNDDGYEDLILRNNGGYSNKSSKGTNMKAEINGKLRAIPAYNKVFPSPTTFEPGKTRIFINQNKKNNWIKIKLIDNREKSYNRFAIGAKVIVNGKSIKVMRSGSGSFVSNIHGPLIFGLGKDKVNKVEIKWPGSKKVDMRNFKGLRNQLLEISYNEE
jgi:hypothetical protein